MPNFTPQSPRDTMAKNMGGTLFAPNLSALLQTLPLHGSACPDSCCVGWEVVVDDDAAAFLPPSARPLGGAPLREAMTIDADGDRIFTMADGHCPFWTHEHLCRLELELGPEAPCATCRKFPRLTQDYGVFTEYGLTLACPEAARQILTQSGPWTLGPRVSREIPKRPNVTGRSFWSWSPPAVPSWSFCGGRIYPAGRVWPCAWPPGAGSRPCWTGKLRSPGRKRNFSPGSAPNPQAISGPCSNCIAVWKS